MRERERERGRFRRKAQRTLLTTHETVRWKESGEMWWMREREGGSKENRVWVKKR
jgi:hypothetical protein